MEATVEDTDRAKRFAELLAWVGTDEAAEETRQAVERAREDAEIFLRMDHIDPEVYVAPTTL